MTINEKAAMEMVKSYEESSITTFSASLKLPDKNEIISILEDIKGLFFPAYFADCKHNAIDFAEERISSISFRIKKQIELAIKVKDEKSASKRAKEITEEFITKLPNVHRMLLKDVEATCQSNFDSLRNKATGIKPIL